jgi:Fe-S cluster assembly protein SufD
MLGFNSIQSIKSAWKMRVAQMDSSRRQVVEDRERMLDRSLVHGIPNTRHEDWKYTSLRPIIEGAYDLSRLPDSSGRRHSHHLVESVARRLAPDAIPLVFVDGQIDFSWPGSDALDPEWFQTLQMTESQEEPSWWQQWQSANGMDQIFAGLSAAMASDGVVISLRKSQALKRPIHIMHLDTLENSVVPNINRVLISVPECAHLRVYEEFFSVSENGDLRHSSSWTVPLTQLRLGPLADCGYYRIVTAPGAMHTGAVTATLERGSRLESFSLIAGAKLARLNLDIRYTAPDAECFLDGLYLVNDAEHVDHHTTVEHLVGHCRSHQLYKGILAGKSRAVFNGKVFIRKDAQATEAYQTNKNLLLSSEAEVDTKPQLEIDADDVKASHGAAIGTINQAELFYLQSRCIGRSQAMAMLCRGFADDVIMRVKDSHAKTVLGRHVSQWFNSLITAEEML